MKKRIGILTGGGDVQPLNSVISEIKIKAKRENIEVYGFLNGWKGIIENNFIDLSKISIPKNIGGTILRSSRVNLKNIENSSQIAIENLKRLNISYLIVIGGEDTLSNSFLIMDFPQILISKTIDNDVGLIKKNIKFDYDNFINYFTLGHPTAAQKLVSFVSYEYGIRTTAYSHERIIFIETMGMHAGWLALSSSLGDPDFIIIPEFPLNYEDFLIKLLELYKIQRHAVVVVAEGARWGDGRYISCDDSEKDDFGHPRFKGSAEVLAKKVKKDLSKHFDARNINSVNPSYLYRSGKPSKVDKNCAFLLGNAVIEIISNQLEQPVFLSLTYSGKNYNYEMIPLKELNNMSNFYRQVDDSLYDHKNYQATDIAKKYWRSFIQSFPKKKYGVFI